jgi:hypothetical protein
LRLAHEACDDPFLWDLRGCPSRRLVVPGPAEHAATAGRSGWLWNGLRPVCPPIAWMFATASRNRMTRSPCGPTVGPTDAAACISIVLSPWLTHTEELRPMKHFDGLPSTGSGTFPASCSPASCTAARACSCRSALQFTTLLCSRPHSQSLRLSPACMAARRADSHRLRRQPVLDPFQNPERPTQLLVHLASPLVRRRHRANESDGARPE